MAGNGNAGTVRLRAGQQVRARVGGRLQAVLQVALLLLPMPENHCEQGAKMEGLMPKEISEMTTSFEVVV